MELSTEVKEVLDKIYKQTKPVSIFIYGSRARGDYKKDSDYEVGILFHRGKALLRRELKQLHDLSNLNLYPFIYEDFINYSLDTPFPKAVYLREILEGAQTVIGKKVVEKMEPPAVKTSDLLEVGIFQVAYALGAILSSRQEDWITTGIQFTKSTLFGARALVILETNKFPLEYDQIALHALSLELDPEYKDVIRHAIDVRKGTKIDTQQLYTNLTFLNQIVVRRIKDELKSGNKTLLKGAEIS
jgi:predicted nucleotidyltransferase